MVVVVRTKMRRARRALGLASLLALSIAPAAAFAQLAPPRGQPILRTPPVARTVAPVGTSAPATGPGTGPAAPAPPTGPAPATGPATPGGASPAGNAPGGASPAGLQGGQKGAGATGDDPMASVKQGAKDIEFKPKPAGFKVKFNMNDADLAELVTAISNITGKRFIYGGKLRSIKATTVCPEDITAGEAYSAFLSILEANGMTVVPHGRFLKIVETPGVVTENTPIYGPATPVPDEERYVTRMYRLQHIDAQEASTVLSKFKTKDGDISVYQPSNLLIITEPSSNVQRMLRIVEEIDVGGAGDQLYVEPLHYVSSAELATKLNEILGLNKGGAGAAPGAPGAATKQAGARIIADERGNALVMVANEGDYARLLELIKVMDVKQTGEGEIHVHKLQFASCNQTSGQSPQPGMLQTLQTLTGAGGVGARPGTTPGAPAGIPGQAGRPGGAAAQDEVFEGRIRMSCDDATNALITISSARDWSQLFPVIEQLDRPRRQVFIEAVIMDVSVDRTTDFGIAYHGGAPIDFGNSKQGLFYGGNNILGSIAPQNLEALALGVRGPDIDGSTGLLGTGVSIPALGVALNAMAKDGDTNVLATPHILATDNTPADIQIGQNIPLQTNVGGFGGLAGLAGQAGAQAGLAGGLGGLLGGGLGGFGQAQRQDVGTKIKVTPHVNDSDQVRLELQEEISEAGSPLGNLGAIPINKRTANTTLVVRDQQTVVIGGLVRDYDSTSETKIPVLGDIPLIGFLFKSTSKKRQKSNLLLVLTPYVIRDQDDLRAIFERKMQERQEFLDRYFVFSESQPWEPPHDYQRSNGLVEDIRQSFIQEADKERIAEELKLKPRKTHEARPPIALPTMGSRPSAMGDVTPASNPAAGGDKRPMVAPVTPRLLPPGAPPPKPEKVE